MCPLGACRLTWLLYWKAGKRGLRIGSWPTTPRPRTVSKVPDKEKMRQCLSRSWTLSSPRFSSRIQYRHYKRMEHLLFRFIRFVCNTHPVNRGGWCFATAHIERYDGNAHILGSLLVHITHVKPRMILLLPRLERILTYKWWISIGRVGQKLVE